jgi:plastocyanin
MKLVLIGAVLLVVIGGVWYLSSSKTPEPGTGNQVSTGNLVSNVITITSSGFSPSTLGVKQGETITFENEGAQLAWPASAIHPTHTVYPNSSIAKCGTAEENSIFDSCKGLLQGEAWSFQFDIPGTWKYHDHLNVSHYGTIIVE